MFEQDDIPSSYATSASQMSTQPQICSQNMDINGINGGDENVWGCLFPLRPNVKVYHLSNSSYCFGRGSVDHQLNENCFDIALLPVISKQHFRITKEDSSSGVSEPIVFIEDLSSNGTYLNKKLIGKGQKAVLTNNAEIGLAQSSTAVFVFYDRDNDTDQYPIELTSKYTLTKELGKGNFGEVRLAYQTGTLDRCAVKIIKKKVLSANGTTMRMNDLKQIQNEVELLQSINHVCIVRLWDVVESDDRIFIIMELAEGGELFDRIVTTAGPSGGKYLAESVTKFYCYQLALAIAHLHSQGITHRDLKPENILLASEAVDSCVKLTDFGLSKMTRDASQMSTFCGTQMYLAPELLDFNVRHYTRKVDLWSFGVIIFVCLCGCPPFRDPAGNDLNMSYLIRKGIYKFSHPAWKTVSEEAKDLVRKLLVTDADQRYDAKQTLEHPWFKNDKAMLEKADTVMRSAQFVKPSNKRPLSSPETTRRMQEDKTPRLTTMTAELELNSA